MFSLSRIKIMSIQLELLSKFDYFYRSTHLFFAY